MMMSDEFKTASPDSLGKMLEPALGGQTALRPEELGAILHHQMKSPIRFVLTDETGAVPVEMTGIRGRTTSQGLLVESLEHLLNHPHPPLELLLKMKEFAKANRDHPEASLPGDIATLLYFASILAALVRCGQRITTLDDDTLRDGIEWALRRTWVDPPLRELFREARQFILRSSGGQ